MNWRQDDQHAQNAEKAELSTVEEGGAGVGADAGAGAVVVDKLEYRVENALGVVEIAWHVEVLVVFLRVDIVDSTEYCFVAQC